MARRAVTQGHITLLEAEDDDLDHDPELPWYFSIEYEGKPTFDAIPGFRTPGAALDGAIRWARDRGMDVAVVAAEFSFFRIEDMPNSPEESKSRAQRRKAMHVRDE